MTKKNIYVLSGFLGSGKTTLLKQLIQSLKDQIRRPAIIMNELGSVSIDSEAVDKDTPLQELLDGCICCTVQDQLDAKLQELLMTETFDDLIIETTGAAHPVEAIDAIMSPLFSDRFEWKGIITTIDSFVWKNRESLTPQVMQLLYEQIKHADLLLINKVDLITEMDQGMISFEIQQINSHAPLFLTQQSHVPLSALQNMSMSEKGERQAVHAKDHLHLTVVNHVFDQKVALEDFENWIRSHTDRIYRMKGYVPFSHAANPMMFQYSYGMPIYMPEDMKMPKNLVIIGHGLDKSQIRSELKSLEMK
ncbi:G3E family GTPase [Bacillus ectoiniformans]|uniref:CobW family GTP-binding protein n=1 Tax=Bacillus ectoiniformans TaxID=1494429 RepID=UPI001959B381|nr:CobW family GTP-binding protein [Bacillus ectoiniformans]MBM7647890.1 G3E family GTPase [Bacillus ectoiniformans]